MVFIDSRSIIYLGQRPDFAKFAEALAKGQPSGGKIALTIFRGKLDELF